MIKLEDFKKCFHHMTKDYENTEIIKEYDNFVLIKIKGHINKLHRIYFGGSGYVKTTYYIFSKEQIAKQDRENFKGEISFNGKLSDVIKLSDEYINKFKIGE